MSARPVIRLDPIRGVHQPDYELSFFRDGNARVPIKGIDLRSVVAIQTSKDLNDVSGTFTITVKDKQFRHRVREMDVVRIRLKGHFGGGAATVLKGVVDRVRAAGSADPYAAQEDTVIEGRCVGKYLQVTSLFLPVWDPQAALPTALLFGLGDGAKKVGGNRPYDIFRYLVRKYTYGESGLAGVSGIPNSRFWLDHYTRFSKNLGFQIPFLQFDENSMAEALKRMEILGFTEAWVDELGRVVYRRPQWDAPVAYSIDTDALEAWDFDRGDVATATYVEVIPAGDPGIDSATAQALRSGRAPVPSSWVRAAGSSGIANSVSSEFVVETDHKGHVTTKGKRNHWYRLQRRLGVRPQQVTSPLLVTQEQAQAQAEGLLRFFARATKGGSITVPGAPQLRLGYNARVQGELEGVKFDRTFYIESIAHDYVDGEHYKTNVTLTHGRDPWDAGWHQIALPKADPVQLSTGNGGTLDPAPLKGGGGTSTPGVYVYPLPGIQIGSGTPGVSVRPVDQGVDYISSGPVKSIGRARVTRVAKQGTFTGWPGGGGGSIGAMLVYQLLDGDRKGWFVYLAENVDPVDGLHVGQVLKAGETYAHARGTDPWLEIGWAANGSGQTLSSKHGTLNNHPRHSNTPEGIDFYKFVQSLKT